MKKIISLLTLLICGITTHAQMHFSSGGSGSNAFPFGSTSSNKIQLIYMPSDFSGTPAPGMITKIYFRTPSTGFPKTFTNMVIKMGYTTASNTVTGAFTTAGMVTVLNATTQVVNAPNSGGWVEIPLTTPFYYNFTSNIIVEASQTAYTTGFNVMNNTANGNKRLYALVTSATGTANTGLADFGFDKTPAIPDNAGVFEVTEPKGFCAGTYPVKVRVMNNGNNAINNVQINWTLDGVAQAPINYTTPIPSLMTSTSNSAIVSLGNVTFANATRNVKVWTSMPNSRPDTFNVDDTLTTPLRASLSGIFTVGGTAPDYPNLSDAVADLNAYGICGPVTFNFRNGTYTSQGSLNQVVGASNTNRITFQSESGDPANVVISFNGTSTANNYVMKMNGSSYVTIKNLSMSNTTTNAFGIVIEASGAATKDSIVNCILSGAAGLTTSSLNTVTLYVHDLTGDGLVVQNNTVRYGSYGMRLEGTGTTNLAPGMVVEDNDIIDVLTYSAYLYYTDNAKFRNNNISTTSTATHYGIYGYYNDNAFEVTGNKITSINSGIKYGMYILYSDGTATVKGLIANNTIAAGDGTADVFGLRNQYSSYMRVYNNSVNINGLTGAAGYFYYSSTTYISNDIRNNIFYNAGAGNALYVYNPDVTYLTTIDYNNIYTEGPKLVAQGTPATEYRTLDEWRRASGMDKNSIAYNPGFTSATDLTPDPADSASWSVNGRGVHIAGNDKDINGATRITTLAAGVPDLGAYEFTPTSTPPAAEATPAAPENGITQYFTFGQDTVAVIDWSGVSLIPPAIAVRQYTGTAAPQLSGVTITNSYFYTDIDVLSSTYDFNARIYYKDPWMGTLSGEGNMKMLKKEGSFPWVAYNGSASTTNTSRNYISASGLTSHGYFTGVDNGVVFSAHIMPASKVIFCPGGSVTLNANPVNAGYTYQWKLNGLPIAGATLASYSALAAGVYQVDVMNGAQMASTMPIEVYVIASPSSAITTSGPTKFCVGGSVTLNVQTSPDAKYQWRKNGVDIAGANTTVYTATTDGIYTIQVNNRGCATTSGATTVAIGPISVNLGRDTVFCQNSAVTLNAGNPGAQYLWSTGATTQTISVVGNTSTSYSVRVTAGPGCEANDTISMTIDPLPEIIGISYVRAGNSYQLSPGGVTNANRYLWIFGDGKTDTNRVITHDYTYRPNTVKLVVFNACGSDTADANLFLSVDDAASLKNLQVNVFPNPTQSMLTVTLEGESTMKDLIVLNHLGQVVYRRTMDGMKKEQKIDVSNMANGHYILRVHTNDNSMISKQFDVLR